MLYKKLTEYCIVFSLIVFLFSISFSKADNIEVIEIDTHMSQDSLHTYTGWWIYGDGQHIFKNKDTLEELDMEFINEDVEEIKDLYLSICEMEYFPVDCEMRGFIKDRVLYIFSFEILYVEGCEE